jgi:hypothetical protein
MPIPPFHTRGDPQGDFYAVAFVPGSYIPPSARSETDAFYVLNFSPSEGFTKFSHYTVSIEGRYLAYHRGVDELDTLEHAILDAWYHEHVPPHAWRLFPADTIEEDAFHGDAAVRSAYDLARRRLARILWRARACANTSVEPLFRFDEISASELLADTSQNEKLLKLLFGDQIG